MRVTPKLSGSSDLRKPCPAGAVIELAKAETRTRGMTTVVSYSPNP
jgi:hypothetical protein